MTKPIEKQKTKVILISAICVVLVAALVVVVMAVSAKAPKTAKCEGVGKYLLVVESEEEVKAFISQFGYQADEFYSLQQAYVPIEFNQAYEKYNEVQKAQGLNLEKFKGEKCKLYIYTLKEFKDLDKAYVSLMVLDDRVIGGHISTLSNDGYIYTFSGVKYEWSAKA